MPVAPDGIRLAPDGTSSAPDGIRLAPNGTRRPRLNVGGARRSRGFSLIEVLVAVIVVAIGLLGLAKMESLALSSTGVASLRSLIAIQASSLAASMHANRGFWASGDANVPYTVDPVNNTWSTAAACTTAGSSACNPQQMAFYDLQQWQIAMQALTKSYTANITCTTINFPVNCLIVIQWTENVVSNNGSAVAGQQQSFTNQQSLMIPTYKVYVQP
ncbi:MAG TPA: type IV pilus modification protein PilV [Steroidobacteraceae bacterium]|jgi:type IV pilus assembly protein PilV|nr:type IV pilus modification protein PilV [Steroidobacteraceae bacterium]